MDGEENRKNGSTLEDLRGLETLGRRAFSAARAVGALASTATSEIWGPVAVVVLILAIATFSIVLGNQGQASEQSSVSPQTSANPATNNNILNWASQINDALQPFGTPCNTDSGPISIFNSMLQTITNGSYTATKRSGSACGLELSSTYFCTDLVIDTYNLAGIKNNLSEGVLAMISGWSSLGLTVQKNNDVKSLKPGDAVFWVNDQNNPSPLTSHVGIIYSINIKPNGDGILTTLDANTNNKKNRFNIRDWALIGDWLDGANIPWYGLAPR